ncbi:MAG: 2-oxo acid dehydrogenase subunit E2 [Ruminococcaceae bacterium]|nr:2-oxo acid dehydrogenase subunit E2 [Oscillospiraceae bacterium]
MAAGILMPKAGITVETCIITKWRKNVGDTVNVGDIIFDYETDKATFECESTESGEILEIFFNDGDEVPCLVNVCAVGKAGEDCSALRPVLDGDETAAPAEASAAAPAEAAAPAAAAVEAAPAVPVSTGDIKISPRAKALTESKHIDPHFATPTGPYGRVIERDIRALIESGVGATAAAFDGASAAGMATGTGLGGRVSVGDLNAPAAPAAAPAAAAEPAVEYEDVKFSSMRKAISKSMTVSLSTIPQLTHNTSFDATELMAYRAKLKANAEKLGLPNITLNDMVLFVVSRVLLNYKDLNANMLDDKTIRQFKDVHLGMAVDTDRGLMVPTIRFANKKSLAEISAEAKALAAQCKAGNISPDLLSGATFTISNVGSLGIESFTPVINPPQTGILGVDTLMTKVRMVNGELQGYQAMGLSLTYDHRALDGTPASKFLRDVAFGLENFSLFLSK